MLHGGIPHILVVEVDLDPFRLCPDTSQGADGGAGQSHIVFGRGSLGYTPFQVGVEQFVRVQFRRVAAQIDDFDLVRIFLEPLLDPLGVMYAPNAIDLRLTAIRRLACEAADCDCSWPIWLQESAG